MGFCAKRLVQLCLKQSVDCTNPYIQIICLQKLYDNDKKQKLPPTFRVERKFEDLQIDFRFQFYICFTPK